MQLQHIYLLQPIYYLCDIIFQHMCSNNITLPLEKQSKITTKVPLLEHLPTDHTPLSFHKIPYFTITPLPSIKSLTSQLINTSEENVNKGEIIHLGTTLPAVAYSHVPRCTTTPSLVGGWPARRLVARWGTTWRQDAPTDPWLLQARCCVATLSQRAGATTQVRTHCDVVKGWGQPRLTSTSTHSTLPSCAAHAHTPHLSTPTVQPTPAHGVCIA